MSDRLIGVVSYKPEPRILPPFEGPRLKVARARRHLTELEASISDYSKRAQPQWQWHYEPHYGHMKLWQLTFTETAPTDLPLIIGDVAHNLRSALDVMLCDIARLRGKSSSDVKFLFAVSSADWEERLRKHPLKKLGADVVQAVRLLSPTRDSNSGLRALHDLDVLNKHELVALTFAAAWINMQFPAELRGALSPQALRGDLIRVSEDDMFFIRQGMEFGKLKRPETGPFPFFTGGNPQGSPFAGEPVLETMHHAANTTEEVIESFARQFG